MAVGVETEAFCFLCPFVVAQGAAPSFRHCAKLPGVIRNENLGYLNGHTASMRCEDGAKFKAGRCVRQ